MSVLLTVPAMFLAMALSAYRLAGRVDVIHGNWSLPGLIGALMARLRGRPAIVTLRGEDVTRAASSPVARSIMYLSLRLNTYTATVSEAMTDDLQRRYPAYASRIRFIPNGVDSETQRLRRPPCAPLRILTVGNLIQRKGIDTIIESLALLRRTHEAVLHIVGDGPLRDELEARTRELDVTDHVYFCGYVAPEAVIGHLQSADIFVLASKAEGRPNALLEAMAISLPVVASDIPGVRELLASGRGLLFPAGNARECAGQLRRLIEHPEMAMETGRNANLFIQAAGLTWRRAATQYHQLYLDALKQRSAR